VSDVNELQQRRAPSADRNSEPILGELREILPSQATVLEIASGTGQHAAYFAAQLPAITWQPSDIDPVGLESVRAYVAGSGLDNLREPLVIDVTTEAWGIDAADVVYCCNMIHISPWACTEALFAGAGRILSAAGMVVTYGPYRFADQPFAPSNEAFDRSLRSRDPSWGVRDAADIRRVAIQHGLAFERAIAMPANNHILVFRRPAQ
jgi:SAM-dependent methyltransferase